MEMELVAVGTANWNYFINPNGYVVSVPKPGRIRRGCKMTGFGDLRYLTFMVKNYPGHFRLSSRGKELIR